MKRTSSHIDSILPTLPRSPGVYQFYDVTGQLLYIGKAVNLKSRVSSYFKSDLSDRPWVRQMIPRISDIRIIQAENEVEALILESNLIKKHQPKYNSASKDDKRYAWIAIERRVPFPRVKKVRELNTNARYFGPYPDGRAVNHVLKFIRTLYPYRDCNLPMFPNRPHNAINKSRRCVYHHIGLCSAPCDNLISTLEYKKNIENIIKTLQGTKKSHIRELEKQMLTYAKQERYEDAATLRDKMQDLAYLSQRIDIQYGDAEDEFRSIQMNRFTAGIKEAVAHLDLSIPEHQLKKLRIECYDISNLGDEITYGSMVVAEGPQKKPSFYRIFKIHETGKRNDPEMLKKILMRRLKHKSKETAGQMKIDESLSCIPSIILLDGAQAQLSAVASVIPRHIGLLAISKGKHLKRAGEQQVDEFWILSTDRSKSKKVRLENPFIFQHLRDEAHRFAIKHLRNGKRFLQKKSILDEIPGVGPRRKKLLIQKFGSVDALRQVSLKEIVSVLHNARASQAVYQYLHPSKE